MCLPFFRRKRDQEDDYYANNYNTANNVNQGAAYIRLLGAGHHFIEDWDQGGSDVGGKGGGGDAAAGCDSYGCDSGGGGDGAGGGGGGCDGGGGGC
ncbi:hypothetical protein BFJ66_g7 [Fusarium oxysporum f. sp. cepae]|uniref:Uncharacterized protein n=1 Tax=Fusarium oxysporum f. sp. cepae TaxID=396571 RepID=A0A3L6P001_FUSOX|nr:hypothetical protein BFJ65_g3384 [Fusarium oxysporum f. sp. cepae]RKK59184.1 hypothetical protein BFJ67_g2714 [Fusarium oxysporum f. sp. cepae]RKK64112.1 hypothetical protein BFJ66_g7 [Fusarium oxysporum f. sp. cepae]